MERKLRLVPRSPREAPSDLDDEAPITDEEREAAEALRLSLERGEEPFAADLRAAFTPRALDPDDLDALVARALGDEGASTSAEREAAERLRAELDGEAEIREGAVLEQLRLAAKPRALDPATNDALIEAALLRARRRAVVRRLGPVTIAFVTGITAIAAGLALFVGPPRGDASAMIRARSAAGLFDASTPFPKSGGESARIDRIAAARATDLRANRFAKWGVR
jgi:hypothetical protein